MIEKNYKYVAVAYLCLIASEEWNRLYKMQYYIGKKNCWKQ